MKGCMTRREARGSRTRGGEEERARGGVASAPPSLLRNGCRRPSRSLVRGTWIGTTSLCISNPRATPLSSTSKARLLNISSDNSDYHIQTRRPAGARTAKLIDVTMSRSLNPFITTLGVVSASSGAFLIPGIYFSTAQGLGNKPAPVYLPTYLPGRISRRVRLIEWSRQTSHEEQNSSGGVVR